MSRPDAVAVFGEELVADALADTEPARADAASVGTLARILGEHARDDLRTVRLVVLAWLSTLEPSVARAVVRSVVGGVRGALADVARDERRGAMH